MKAHHILIKDLIDFHILIQGKNVLYSPFEERILFPIYDHLGFCCGFGGRIFKQNDERPKYLNTKENPFFSKGSLLFGLQNAKKSIQQRNTVILVEGYLDCIAMIQHGFPHTIATLGTACTLNHLKQLSRYAHTMYILYDGDRAGQQAILRLAQIAWQVNVELYVACLPSGEDPASFLKKNQNPTILIQQARTIFNFFIESYGKNFFQKSLSEKMQAISQILEMIFHIDDPLKQDILLQQTAHTIDIPFQTLKTEIKKLDQKKTTFYADTQNNTQSSNPTSITLTNLEKKIFCAIMNNIQIENIRFDIYSFDYFPEPFGSIIQRYGIYRKGNEVSNFGIFFETLNTHEKQMVSKLLLEEENEVTFEEFKQLVTQFQKKQWKTIVSSIKLKLTQAQQAGDINKVNQIMCDFLELKKTMMHAISQNSDKISE